MITSSKNASTPLNGLAFVRTAWVLSEDITGMKNQCLGLTDALGLTPQVKHVSLRFPWRFLPPRLFPFPLLALDDKADPLAPPWPDLLIACGRKSVPLARAIRRLSGGRTFTVQTQDPTIAAKNFDLVIPPAHDHVQGKNVFPIIGAPHRVTPEKLQAARDEFAARFRDLKRPLVGVLIGGPNRAFAMTDTDITRLCNHLISLQQAGSGVALALSRRTPPSVASKLRDCLSSSACVIFSPGPDNPYLGLLAHADAFVVTADSVNMATEAAVTGKPLFIAALSGRGGKFYRFHASLIARGIARPFEGKLAVWRYEPLQETLRAAQEIRRRLTLKLYQRGR